MESDSTLSAIALAVSLVCFAAASIGEASIASLRREMALRLASQGVESAAEFEDLYSLPAGAGGTLRLLKVFALSSGLVSAVALIIAQVGVKWVVIGPSSLGVLVLLGGIDMASKAVASRYGERIAMRVAGPVRLLARLLNPMLGGGTLLTRRLLGAREEEAEPGSAGLASEIGFPLDSDGEPLDEHEVRMILGVVGLDKTVAREIMVPRVDMVAAEIGTSIAELAEQMVKVGHSRIPIYRGDLDHIVGLAYARDMLSHMLLQEETAATLVESLTRPALFIPESKTLEELLKEFQKSRVHMAIVIDEYGGVSGLVTIEDLLEEIVGEIQDEFDAGEPQIERINANEMVIDARVSIDELNELLSVSIQGDGFDTLGGLVYHQLGRIPSPGDSVEYDGFSVQVISTVGRRLKRLRVKKSVG